MTNANNNVNCDTMKTQITKILTLNDDGRNYQLNGDDALCGCFVRQFFLQSYEKMPKTIKVTASIRSWAFKDAKRIWIRHQSLDCTSPSSWTWEKNGYFPDTVFNGGGMYSAIHSFVWELLGAKLSSLPFHDHTLNNAIPLYVRIVDVSK